jgi:hypothetical protein
MLPALVFAGNPTSIRWLSEIIRWLSEIGRNLPILSLTLTFAVRRTPLSQLSLSSVGLGV